MLYSKTRLTRLLNISPHLMRKLEKEGILQPKKKIRNRKYYGFNEYLGLRIIQRLRENGISPKKMVASLKSVQKSFQKLKSPLTEVKFISVGKEVVMKYGGNVIDSDGQYLLPQLFEEGKADVYSLSQTAWYWFEMANKYDQEPETYSKAEFYYKQALHYQPEMFEALMNLGTLYYKSGKMKAAETYYLKALKLEPANYLLLYNLGNLYDEKKDYKKASSSYEKAIQAKEDYPDAHYNLALLYMRIKEWGKSIYHFQFYLTLDEESIWAEIAKKQIENIKDIIVREKEKESHESE